MEISLAVVRAALAPIEGFLVDGSQRIHWLYLACALAIALGAQWRQAPSAGVLRALASCLPRSVYAHPSARADYRLWIVNGVVIALVLPFFLMSRDSAVTGTIAALAAAGPVGPGFAAGPFASLLYTATDVLALDAGLFLAHYLQHRIPLLWEFHKTHHSAEVLTPITVFRMHPLDVWLNMSLTGGLMGINAGVFGYLYGTPPAVLSVMGVNVVMFAFLIAGYHLRHSHVWVMFPAAIARHISSPALHLIHHSTAARHANTNFAQIFTFWDRLTGTLYLPKEQEAIEFGLGAGDPFPARSLLGLYLAPFRNIAERWRRRSTGARAGSELSTRGSPVARRSRVVEGDAVTR